LEADVRARVLEALHAKAGGKGATPGAVAEEVDLTIEA